MCAEPLHEPVGAALGADEHERQPPLVVVQLAHQGIELRLVLDADESVLDVAAPFGGDSMLVTARIGRVDAGEAADLAVEGGGEEQRLALARQLRDDPVHGRAKAHVEHAVGLVEHQHPHLAE